MCTFTRTTAPYILVVGSGNLRFLTWGDELRCLGFEMEDVRALCLAAHKLKLSKTTLGSLRGGTISPAAAKVVWDTARRMFPALFLL